MSVEILQREGQVKSPTLESCMEEKTSSSDHEITQERYEEYPLVSLTKAITDALDAQPQK